MENENLADKKEIHYRQKSRIQWHRDGERNTKYYHRIVKNRRRRNTFASLNINGVMVDDKQAIREEIVSHFENKFKLNSEEFIDISTMNLRQISTDSAESIEAQITEEEVLAALKKLGQNRAPGPDGFQ
ncbi:hypothetical protein MKW98_021116, partial [Papaver atlanticum]